MYVKRLSRNALSDGVTLTIGGATVYLQRDPERSSKLAIGIEAPNDMPITMTDGIPTEEPSNRLPIPPQS